MKLSPWPHQRGQPRKSRRRQKQISIFVPITTYTRLRLEAARRKIPITELVRRWINPQLESLPEHGGVPER